MGIDITTYRIRIGPFGPGIAEIYSSSITVSDIHYRMLVTMVSLTSYWNASWRLSRKGSCKMFVCLWELTSASCQSMAHIAIYINRYTRKRGVRPSTCNVVRNAFGHLIRAPHYFQTLGWIRFIYGLMIGIGPEFFLSTIPTPSMIWRSRSQTWKFIVEVYSC